MQRLALTCNNSTAQQLYASPTFWLKNVLNIEMRWKAVDFRKVRLAYFEFT
jgi:hypothetical protein